MNENPFDQARSLFEQGLQALQQGQPNDAETHLLACLQWMPGRVSPLVALGAARLRQGRAEDALAPLQDAVAQDPSRSDAWGHQADALLRLGRPEEALKALDHADPAEHATAWHRASALNALGQHALALDLLNTLGRQQPHHAATWLETGRTLQCLARHAEAGPAYQRAVELQSDLAQAWSLLGQWHQDQGQAEQAARALQQALALGHDPALNTWFLAAAQGGQDAPDQAPQHYVQQLFDGYAAQFDHHLVQVLGYSAPQRLLDLLKLKDAAAPAVATAPERNALDLGCGTGLCGPGLRQWVGADGAVDGVDLSPGMLQHAQTLNVYRHLFRAEAVDHLLHTTQRYDLVLAGDVFIYIGALHTVFAAVRRVLRQGGQFVFSVEEIGSAEVKPESASSTAQTTPPGVLLRTSMRYAHTEGYLHEIAKQHGFSALALQRGPLRLHQGQPVAGLFMLLGLGC
jgi:predicted TPR repeat methyltransferase